MLRRVHHKLPRAVHADVPAVDADRGSGFRREGDRGLGGGFEGAGDADHPQVLFCVDVHRAVLGFDSKRALCGDGGQAWGFGVRLDAGE